MAYVLLALGALMSVAGAVAAVNGYGIIQVEQGWASVIAGVTLFTGGILTISLALVLRALGQLQALRPAEARDPATLAATREPAFAPAHPAAEAKPEAANEAGYPTAYAEAAEATPAPEPDHFAAEPFTAPEPNFAPLPRAPAPAASPRLSDDWFDRAFAELDQPPVEPSPAMSRSRQTEPVSELTVPSRAREPAYAAAEEAPLTGSSDPAPSAAIIGRYEADETSYVMYADGSIEAQTQSGVYRFASMAELKAFIES